MNEWKEFKKEHYGQGYSITYEQGMIDFASENMDDVRGGSFRSYDEYLDVQRNSCGQARRYWGLPHQSKHNQNKAGHVPARPYFFSFLH